ncbi:hypothetical protein UF64_00240 [Thalassospira sp. HJ]|uniref:Gfo/Idh/MocA family protein n=1 Tax=Thalassospira sp. HJ TaxID=1616823 RepID=UPI0005CF2D14|nr:Gfo/Idh/MocA family oxidoreductase [Thalassospira sp. HJ]KJE37153.1 hypothetical protein UF64_00240 [Thalassospira sp. HJ]
MLRVGVVGLGVGERHIHGFNGSPYATVTRICDINPRKLADVADRSGISDVTTNAEDILLDPEIDVVSIASFDEYHAKQIVMALDAGKHVFVEKPLCLTEMELDEICEAYAHAKIRGENLYVSSNFILRRELRFMKLKKNIELGKLGDIYAVEGSYDYGRVSKLIDGWRAQTPKYSVMHGGGIHILDFFKWLTGYNFLPHAALANKTVTLGTKFRPYDHILSIGKFGDEILGKISANFGSQTAHFHQIKVYGTKGSFIHDCGVSTYFFGSEPNVLREIENDPFPSSNKGDLLPEFISAIIHNTSLDIDFEHVESIMRASIAVDTLACRE